LDRTCKKLQRQQLYKWVAGYNPLNEPTDSRYTRLVGFYDKVYAAIRSVDPNHAIFFDGNTFASDFSHFGDAHKRWENTAYSIHDYSSFGFPAAPQEYVGSKEQRARLRRSYEKKREWMDEPIMSVDCVCGMESGVLYMLDARMMAMLQTRLMRRVIGC
jgi:hypothetical protein